MMISKQQVPSKLEAFDEYKDFEAFCKNKFDLEPWEYRKLYEVLIKLESVGEDPVQSMGQWESSLSEQECLEFIRFMILVDSMDVTAFCEAEAA